MDLPVVGQRPGQTPSDTETPAAFGLPLNGSIKPLVREKSNLTAGVVDVDLMPITRSAAETGTQAEAQAGHNASRVRSSVSKATAGGKKRNKKDNVFWDGNIERAKNKHRAVHRPVKDTNVCKTVPHTSGGAEGRYSVPATFGLPFDLSVKRSVNPLLSVKSDVDDATTDGEEGSHVSCNTARNKVKQRIEETDYGAGQSVILPGRMEIENVEETTEDGGDVDEWKIQEMSWLDPLVSIHAIKCYACLLFIGIVIGIYFLVSANGSFGLDSGSDGDGGNVNRPGATVLTASPSRSPTAAPTGGGGAAPTGGGGG